jgi:hypothetical protein
VYLPPGAIVERSLLPRGKAAFPWSALSLSEVSKMAQLDDAKRAELMRVLGEDLANTVLASLDESAKSLAEAGIRFKEVVEADAADAAAEKTEVEEAEARKEPEEADGVSVSLDDVALEVVLTDEALAEMAQQAKASVLAELPELIAAQTRPVADGLTALQAAVSKLAGTVEAMQRSDDEKMAEKVRNLPRATVRHAAGDLHRATAAAKASESAPNGGPAPAENLQQRGLATLYGNE